MEDGGGMRQGAGGMGQGAGGMGQGAGGMGQGAGGGKNYGVECLGGRIDEGYSIGEPRVHLRKGGHYRGW